MRADTQNLLQRPLRKTAHTKRFAAAVMNLQWLLGCIPSGLCCTVSPQICSTREHKGCEAVAEGAHDGIDGVVEWQQ